MADIFGYFKIGGGEKEDELYERGKMYSYEVELNNFHPYIRNLTNTKARDVTVALHITNEINSCP